MASRFVSGGVIASSSDPNASGSNKAPRNKTQDQVGSLRVSSPSSPSASVAVGAIQTTEGHRLQGEEVQGVAGPQGTHSAEWAAVQKELEAERKSREEARTKAAQGEEKSLYDILQANKAAKEAAFQEANKLTNQFRALDDDDVDFLDQVRQRKRMEEEQAKRELERGVEAFKQQQQQQMSRKAAEDDGAGTGDAGEDLAGGAAEKEGGGDDEAETWGVSRKRKRRERDGGLVKKKTGERLGGGAGGAANDGRGDEKGNAATADGLKKIDTPGPLNKGPLGLVDYGSDSDD